MTSMVIPARTVRQHPILLTEVTGTDGSRRSDLRVFCDLRGRSVALDVCRECPSCDQITGGESENQACVRCSPPLDEASADLAQPSGRALCRGAVAVDDTVLVRDIVGLFVERRVRMIVVTDASGRAEGVVHESQLIRQIQDYRQARTHGTRLAWEPSAIETASAIMFPAAQVIEDVPLRAAVAYMASAHQRQLLVIDENGRPVGVLVDVDALHALYAKAPHADE